MQWLICYDISDHKQRRRAMRILRSGSLGYQKSGFEQGLINNPTPILANLAPCIEEQDRLLILTRYQAAPDWHLGQGVTYSQQHFIVFS